MDNPTQGNFEVVQDDEPEVIPPMPSDESIHAYVHGKRVQLVKEMMAPDGRMPVDPKDRLVMLAALKDIDNAATSRQRLKADEKANDTLAGQHALIAKVLSAVPNRMTHEIDPDAPIRQAPKLGTEYATPELLEGEMAATLPQQDYATFVTKYLQGQESQSS